MPRANPRTRMATNENTSPPQKAWPAASFQRPANKKLRPRPNRHDARSHQASDGDAKTQKSNQRGRTHGQPSLNQRAFQRQAGHHAPRINATSSSNSLLPAVEYYS